MISGPEGLCTWSFPRTNTGRWLSASCQGPGRKGGWVETQLYPNQQVTATQSYPVIPDT